MLKMLPYLVNPISLELLQFLGMFWMELFHTQSSHHRLSQQQSTTGTLKVGINASRQNVALFSEMIFHMFKYILTLCIMC